MNNISAWAIRHPITPIMLFVVLVFLGIAAFIGLPINLDPDVTFPEVRVTVEQPGAAPTELENQIAQKVEGAIASVGNVRNMTTYILEGVVNIDVVFQIGTPIDRAVIDVRNAVAHVRNDLPQGILEPQVQRQSFTGPFAYYAVTTTRMSPTDLSWFVDNALTKRLLALPGVAQVSRSGGVSREIRVDLDPARMQALGITAYEVNEQMRALNLDESGGRAQIAGGEQAIRVMGGARTPAQLGDTQIIVSGNKSVRLRDIADVHDGIEEVRQIARLNGRPATTFGISKAIGASDVSVAKAVTAELKKVVAENPGLVITTVYSTEPNTERVYDSAISALTEGSVLAVVVVWIFLRSWRATLISALAIPLSAIPTFAFMQAAGFTLNQITLLGLSLVAGVLVDDAIVEIENIVRHDHRGVPAGQFHGRPVGSVFQTIRTHGRSGGILLADGRAAHHARARRVFAAARFPARAPGRRPDHASLSADASLVRRESLENRRGRRAVFRAVVVLDVGHSPGIHAAPGLFQCGGRHRAAARRHAAGYRARLRRGFERPAQGARGHRRRGVRRRRRAATGDALRESRAA
jgi:multidrug efflux pump subunit AcrB